MRHSLPRAQGCTCPAAELRPMGRTEAWAASPLMPRCCSSRCPSRAPHPLAHAHNTACTRAQHVHNTRKHTQAAALAIGHKAPEFSISAPTQAAALQGGAHGASAQPQPTAADDILALGLVLSELLTGHRPRATSGAEGSAGPGVLEHLALCACSPQQAAGAALHASRAAPCACCCLGPHLTRSGSSSSISSTDSSGSSGRRIRAARCMCELPEGLVRLVKRCCGPAAGRPSAQQVLLALQSMAEGA